MNVDRGLPGRLPPGERVLWQGAPEMAPLARAAFHTRAVALYFGLLTTIALGLALARGMTATGAIVTALGGTAAVAMLRLIAWAAARSTVYTLTDRRVVLRIGIALPTSINLPLAQIAAIDLSDGGDVALTLAGTPPLGWLVLWPHARPWKISRPQPMLRALSDAPAVAERIGEACRAATPAERPRQAAAPEPIALMPQAVAA